MTNVVFVFVVVLLRLFVEEKIPRNKNLERNILVDAQTEILYQMQA